MKVQRRKKNVINKLIFTCCSAGSWNMETQSKKRIGGGFCAKARPADAASKKDSWPKKSQQNLLRCHGSYFGNKSIYDAWWIFYEIDGKGNDTKAEETEQRYLLSMCLTFLFEGSLWILMKALTSERFRLPPKWMWWPVFLITSTCWPSPRSPINPQFNYRQHVTL